MGTLSDRSDVNKQSQHSTASRAVIFVVKDGRQLTAGTLNGRLDANEQRQHSMEGWMVAVIVRNDAKVELLASKVQTVNGYRPQSTFWGTWLCTEALGRSPVNKHPLQSGL